MQELLLLFEKYFDPISYIWMTVAAIVFVTMFFVTAPFGRHTSDKWGPTINNKLAWVIMECPSFLIMLYYMFQGVNVFSSFIWVLFAVWLLHYFNRSFIFPLRLKSTPRKMPFAITSMAIFFNLINGNLNGYYLSKLANPADYQHDWLSSPQFIAGIVLFFSGMYINMRSDSMLIALRKPGETGYKLPTGFLFEYLASPNLFGEIIEWLGFALMAKNVAGTCFFVWTAANLVPRAKNHFDWSVQKFENYPKKRKVIIPFVY
ncbi:3-oxo-5-alpha-steroid_4-dehydrogenase [Hexamita inflata]|uniref:3-oxo-5-alpha-steroid 4-dehydrogenase 1 n=1 Tax=Hexamita inflata TaxID=28002 RepID=A0AA86TH14_9EUKA|nr:3-oxo-5-alpha-steroid 4-dehydrogenase [Hexamita inflata]CAI9965056.1 3-oxo-5-alpha-steroid 4-dehydrogenase [Hexamita inflata]